MHKSSLFPAKKLKAHHHASATTAARYRLAASLTCLALACPVIWVVSPSNCHAGIYHRAIADEILQPVPHWSRFFDTVIPKLRSYAPPDPFSGLPPSPVRQQALEKVALLAQQAESSLTADDFADWSGWLVRLMQVEGRPTMEEARRVLERGRLRFPRDWRLAAHLATVYQISGEYDRAVALAQEALDWAPPDGQRFERYHLRLILQRRAQEHDRRSGKLPKDEAVLDDLFGIRWWERSPLPWPETVSPDGQKSSAAKISKQDESLPAEVGEVLQQLLIWFPFDGQLWWLLGEYLVVQQEWNHAVQAFQSANDLRLGGKIFRYRRTQLLEHADRLRAQTDVPAIPELAVNEAPAPSAPDTPLWSRFSWSAWVLLIVGGAFLLFLASWQIWIWTRRVIRRLH